MDDKTLFDWMDSLCESASTAAQGGDLGLVNRLAANGALGYYFTNVYKLQTVSKPTYAAMINHMQEARRLYGEYAAQEAQDERFAAIETQNKTLVEQLAELQKQFAALVEAQKPEPPKKRGKKADEEGEDE